MKQRFTIAAALTFAIMTVCLMIFAFFHRSSSEFIFLILSIYALVSVLFALFYAFFWQRNLRKKKQSSNRRILYLLKSLNSPAMLWDDSLQKVILNDKLREIAEIDSKEENFDPKFVVPWLFGKQEITDAEIKEIIRAKNTEYSFLARKGTPHDVIWNTSAVETDDNGVSVFLTIGIDLAEIRTMQSELKTYSKRLAASEGRHALSMELTEIGILLCEQGSDVLFLSAELQKMLGFTNSTVTVEQIRERVFPLDMVLFENHVHAIQSNMAQFLNEIRVLEIRLCGADGLYRWYTYRFKATRMDSGKLAIGGAILDNTKEKEKDEHIERIAYEDSITKFPNRNKLMIMGEELYQCTVELNSAYWVIVLDIDRFHLINDTCGYEKGNQLLQSFAEILQRSVSLGGFGARISGDNFAIIIRGNGDEKFPEHIITKIQHSFASLAVGEFANRTLSCSAGYARMPRDGKNFESVLEHAEFALSAGIDIMGSIHPYTSEMHDAIIRENNLERQLGAALQKGELKLYYMPKADFSTGAIIGMEALVRWIQPDGSIIQPQEFIHIAEKSQLITQITRFVLYEACRQIRVWKDMGLPKLVVSINMTGADFYQENLCEQVMNALGSYRITPDCLEIELTESLALRDVDMALQQMNQLRALGIRIAMDDFGTGYSSLSYIQQFPFTVLKLDQSFVMKIDGDPVVQEIVASVVRIAKAKNVETLAEGVETPEQARQLCSMGCGYGQGFLYGKPMTAEDMEVTIRNNMEKKIVY